MMKECRCVNFKMFSLFIVFYCFRSDIFFGGWWCIFMYITLLQYLWCFTILPSNQILFFLPILLFFYELCEQNTIPTNFITWFFIYMRFRFEHWPFLSRYCCKMVDAYSFIRIEGDAQIASVSLLYRWVNI